MTRRATKLLIIVLVAGLGAGVACAIAVLRDRRTSDSSMMHLAVPSLWIEENTDAEQAESEVEGHRDLHFENRADKPVTARLLATDCECAHILVGIAPEAWHELSTEELRKRADDPALSWHTLQPGGKELMLPPRRQGLLRMTWKTKSVGNHVFWADLFLAEADERGRRRIEVPVQLIEAVHLGPEDNPSGKEIDIGRFDSGEERTARFLGYSLTRDKFTLAPAPAVEDPCLAYGSPQPLRREELHALSEKIGTTVRSGYRLTVTVKEHVGDRRLDIGPFHRRVVWKSDAFPDHRVGSHINGTVGGEVSLASPEDKSFVDLGTIAPEAPQPVVFTLHSHDPRLRLAVDKERSLSFLRAELLDGEDGKMVGKEKTWRVRVVFRTDSLFRGVFPNAQRRGVDSAAVCSIVFRIPHAETAGASAKQSERRLLVPVRGTVKSF